MSTVSLAPHWSFSDSPDVLTDVFNPNINLCVWERRDKEALSEAARAWAQHNSQGLIQTSGERASIRQALQSALPQQAQALVADVDQLCDMLETLLDHHTWGIRLTVLDRAMCPRYHTDRVLARLITSYCGPGMQWLDNEQIVRPSQSRALDLPPEEDLAHRQLEPGDVALCKGDSWPDRPGFGLIHRSPAVATHQHRVLLTIDLC